MTTTASPDASDKLDDDDYPAYTMGRAAEMTGTTVSGWGGVSGLGGSDPAKDEGLVELCLSWLGQRVLAVMR